MAPKIGLKNLRHGGYLILGIHCGNSMGPIYFEQEQNHKPRKKSR